MKQLLIIGIDPGTTLGYSIIDLEGNILEINSEKELSINTLISRIINYGKPIAIGCDVCPAPKAVETVATKFGAKLIEPDKDLLVKEKDELTSEFKKDYSNAHQKDSLASALYAHEILFPLISKIKED